VALIVGQVGKSAAVEPLRREHSIEALIASSVEAGSSTVPRDRLYES
jgi:hypothetical protein